MQDAGIYGWEAGHVPESHSILVPTLDRLLAEEATAAGSLKVLDLGCGNGVLTHYLAGRGFDVMGVEPSEDGVEAARSAYPAVRFEQGSAYDDLARLGPFDVIVSLEVIEHLYFPHQLAQRAYEALRPGGLIVFSTPYHGYLKNLALSVFDKWDKHHTSLDDHMHIKFFSIRTLSSLLTAQRFSDLRWFRVGRFPWLAKSMIVAARKPQYS